MASSSSNASTKARFSIRDLQQKKRQGTPITVLTAYDATFARLVDSCGIDIVLVGDSLGMVVQGLPNTLSVTLDQMIYHTQAVVRGVLHAQVVTDMPFMSYEISTEEGLRNAARVIREGGAQAVKIEGGDSRAELVRRLVDAGIAVMGHIGLTPQRLHTIGGFRVQGKDNAQAEAIERAALALQDAGAYALVLEAVPADLGKRISASLNIPIIGIGAGPSCDGQVLVLYDLLGMDPNFNPKFVKKYADLSEAITTAVSAYREEVENRTFPAAEHTFGSATPNP